MKKALGIGSIVLLSMIGGSAYSADKAENSGKVHRHYHGIADHAKPVKEGQKFVINGGAVESKPKIVFEYACIAPKDSFCRGSVCYDKKEHKSYTLFEKYVKTHCGTFPR